MEDLSMNFFCKKLLLTIGILISFTYTARSAYVDAWNTVQAMQQNSCYINKDNLKTILKYIEPRVQSIKSNKTVSTIDAFIKNNISAIVNIITQDSQDFYYFISFLIPQYKDIEKATAAQIAQKIDLVEPNVINGILSYINDPTSLDMVAQAIMKSISSIDTTIIETISWKNNTYIQLFAQAAFSSQDTSIITINRILALAQQLNISIPAHFSFEALKKRVENFFAQRKIQLNAITLIMLVMYKHYVGTTPPKLPTITSTEMHALANASTLVSSTVFSVYSTNKQRLALIDAILNKENELYQQGYYTFIHGQKWEFHLVEHWYTRLWEIKTSSNAGDFIFVHCKKPCTDKTGLNLARQLRKKIVQYGEDGSGIRDKVLFLNYAFFGNDGRLGSNSADYLISNSNALPINVSLKDIFTMLNYEKYYNRYEKELQDLEKEHKTISSYGHLILVAVPKNKISDYVYLSGPGGVMEHTVINGQYTNDIALIMDTLTHSPEKISNSDVIQFCLVLTDDMLTPSSGLKMYSYNLANQTALAEWQKKSDAIFSRIRAEIINKS